MGLDIALGVMVLIGAIRGWFRGFVIQAIRLGGLVGSVYAATPLRDYIRPHLLPYLTSIPPMILDRMLWWCSAVAIYLVSVGLASLAVKISRKRPYGEPEPNRADQFAGMLLAGAKTAVVAAFVIMAFEKHAPAWVKQTPWVAEQLKASTSLTWNTQYHPADRIWTASPVQHFVNQVKRMGVDKPSGETSSEPESAPFQTASRPPRLDLPALDPNAPDFTEKFDEAFRKLNQPDVRP